MYSFRVEKLVKKHGMPKLSDNEHSGDSSDSSSEEITQAQLDELTTEDIYNLILKELLTWPETPVRQYLLECADWQESEFHKGKWVAYSPIYNRYGGKWTIYDLDGLEFADETNIEFHSWKGDYSPQTARKPLGDLPYDGPRHNFKGNIWTRGE